MKDLITKSFLVHSRGN